MAEYELFCFAQSGNAYKAALYLALTNADWKPAFVGDVPVTTAQTGLVGFSISNEVRSRSVSTSAPRLAGDRDLFRHPLGSP